MKSIFQSIARRIAQPSSMAGIAAMAALVGAGGQAEAVAQIVGGLAALLAVAIDEGGAA